jgi:hypothetical protein
MMKVGRAFVRIIRYGVIVQMPRHANLCPTKHFPFPQNSPAFARPFRELTESLREFLATGTPLNLEFPIPGFTAIVGKSQKGKLFWLLYALLRICTRKTAKFDTACLLFGYFQAKTFKPVT